MGSLGAEEEEEAVVVALLVIVVYEAGGGGEDEEEEEGGRSLVDSTGTAPRLLSRYIIVLLIITICIGSDSGFLRSTPEIDLSLRPQVGTDCPRRKELELEGGGCSGSEDEDDKA